MQTRGHANSKREAISTDLSFGSPAKEGQSNKTDKIRNIVILIKMHTPAIIFGESGGGGSHYFYLVIFVTIINHYHLPSVSKVWWLWGGGCGKTKCCNTTLNYEHLTSRHTFLSCKIYDMPF